MKHNIGKNNKFTDKTISSFFKKNGNVFYLNSTYIMSSTVWTYSNGNIDIYKLSKGKVIEHLKFIDKGIANYVVPVDSELHWEFKECGYELDGDGFGYQIKKSSGIEQQDLPIDIKCFTKLKFKSAFLNKIVEDINTYKMWDVRYE